MSPARPARILPVLALVALAACMDQQIPTEPLSDPAPQASVSATTITVTNTNDAGAGSLRQAIADAQDGAVIRFGPALAGQSIVLASRLGIEKSLTIEGPAGGGITLDGNYANQVVVVPSGRAVILRNLTITRGQHDMGGGIYNGGTLTLEHVTVSGNTAQNANQTGWGGGIITFGTLRVVNSTISGNQAEGEGGGIFVAYNDANLTLINSTVADNTAYTGGGISLFSSGNLVILRNSIIANNSAKGGSNCYRMASFPSTKYEGTNLSDEDSCGSEGAGMLIAADVLLGPLAANGGPTRTHALLAGSPAIDAATDCTVSVDQRHVARPQGAGCDIGAYEFNDYITTPIQIDGSGTVNPNTGVAVITGTMTCSSPVVVELRVTLSQEQKARRTTTIAEASDVTFVTCTGTKVWSIALQPASGGFLNGSASVTARTVNTPSTVAPAQAAGVVKLFWGHK